MAQGRKKNRSPKKSTQGEFRLIAGTWRSRRLSFPAIEGLRPTTDRVRETVFSWLQSDLPGARVLDVFAGSGALGFEALSRGAAELTMLEQDRTAHQALCENAQLLSAVATIHHVDALHWLKASPSKPFDLIFLDPPFRKGLLKESLELLAARGWCAPQASVYVEQGVEEEEVGLPAGWQTHRQKVAGQVRYTLFTVAGARE